MSDQNAKQLATLNTMIAGFTKGLPGGATTFLLRNVAYSQSDLLALLTGFQQTYAAVPDAALAYKAARQARTNADPQATSLIEDVSAALKGALGSTSTGLGAYGVSARKEKKPLTSEQNVAKAAKAAATRKARGTLGKKQKSLIKGTVPAAPTEPPATTPGGTPKGP